MEKNKKNKKLALKKYTAVKSSGGATLPLCTKKRANHGKNRGHTIKNNSGTTSNMEIKVYPEGKIHAKKEISYEAIIHRLNTNKDQFRPENQKLVLAFVRDAKLGKTILKGQKKKVGEDRLIKYIQDLKKLDAYFKKPLDQVTEKDMENFILDLEQGVLKHKDRKNQEKPYAPETQAVIKKVIIKFYKWLLGNSRTTPELVSWIDTSTAIKEYAAIDKAQIETMVNILTAQTTYTLVRNRAIIMFLFDTGVRAEELLNIRIRNLAYENDNYKVRVEHSKTKPRTITLPFSKKYIDEWLDVHPLRDNPLAQLFPVTYINLKKIVQRAGKQINQANITPHGLRHSSATYWCQHLTPYELCYRFGWSMASKQPQRYIDRTGLYQEKASKIAKATQLEALQLENVELNKRLARMEDHLRQLFGEDYEEARKILEIVKKEMKAKQSHY